MRLSKEFLAAFLLVLALCPGPFVVSGASRFQDMNMTGVWVSNINVGGYNVTNTTAVCIGTVCRTAWPDNSTEEIRAAINGSNSWFGAVGIGTATPQNKLDVRGSIQAYNGGSDKVIITSNGWIQNGYTGDTMLLMGSDHVDIGTYTSSWQTRVRLINNGYLGIGNLAPTSTLDVGGNISATGNVTAPSFIGTASVNAPIIQGSTEVCIGTDCRTSWPGGFSQYNRTTEDVRNILSTDWVNVSSLPLTEGKKISIECMLIMNSTATGTGPQFNLTMTGTSAWTVTEYSITAITYFVCGGVQTSPGLSYLYCEDPPGPGTMRSPYVVQAYTEQSSAGTFNLMLRSHVNASAVSVLRGSWCRSIEA